MPKPDQVQEAPQAQKIEGAKPAPKHQDTDALAKHPNWGQGGRFVINASGQRVAEQQNGTKE